MASTGVNVRIPLLLAFSTQHWHQYRPHVIRMRKTELD